MVHMGNMGNKSNELNPADYPPVKREFRMATNCEQEDFDQADPNKIIHVMSYNFLADSAIYVGKYSPAPEEVIEFKFRAARIMEEVKQSYSDFMCFQEMDHIDEFYEPKLIELGYSLVAFR